MSRSFEELKAVTRRIRREHADFINDMSAGPREGLPSQQLAAAEASLARLDSIAETDPELFWSNGMEIARRTLDLRREIELLRSIVHIACAGPAPETKAQRNERIRKAFKASGMTVNEFAIAHHATYPGAGSAQLRRLLSNWKCATNAQPAVGEAEQFEPKRNSARVTRDTAERAATKG